MDKYQEAAKLLNLVKKAGARHSSRDNGLIQQLHDLACELGAECPGKEATVHPVLRAAVEALVLRHPGHANQKTHGNRFGAGQAKESLRRLKDDKGAREQYKERFRERGSEKVTVPQGKEADYARGLLVAAGKKDRSKAGMITSAAKGSDFMKASGREQEYIDRLTGAAKQAGLSDSEILGIAQGVGGGKSRVTSKQLQDRRKQAEGLLRRRNQEIVQAAGQRTQAKPQAKPQPKPVQASKPSVSSRLDEVLGTKPTSIGRAQGKTGEIEFQLTKGAKRDPDTLVFQGRKVGSKDKWAKVYFGDRSETLGQALDKIRQKYGWDISI